LLSGQFAEGDKVMVDLDEEKQELVFHKDGSTKSKTKKSS
jgi:hypothetical protein